MNPSKGKEDEVDISPRLNDQKTGFPSLEDKSNHIDQPQVMQASSDNCEDDQGSLLTIRRGKKSKQSSQRKNTSVYVAGLPSDITIDELHEHFKTCGIILPDLTTNRPKIKLYEGEDGKPKGDALIIYLKEESVQLAEKLLDESMIRPGVTIRVQKATFSKAITKPNVELDTDAKRKLRNIHKKLEWR